jgi:hypothetical protein
MEEKPANFAFLVNFSLRPSPVGREISPYYNGENFEKDMTGGLRRRTEVVFMSFPVVFGAIISTISAT